ncbi:hypothetical protein OS493_030443 [Desmophyllum pertusum]|uniref:Uncharacterized protein n=1 Tax=Desmophyllum pertusum TaxID=174260 RepID=A0A9X0CPK0_9CNID|nr:hypothetical protein OS493_030443 [Desmophyllum pertusum]
MKANNDEPVILLSKNNAKALLTRNALDQATLKKEARLLQKEINSGERLFLKKREHLLQRQSRIISEMGKRPLSSCSVQQESTLLTSKWKSETNLAGELSSPKLGRKDGNNKSQRLLFSSLSLPSEGTDNESLSPRLRRKAFSSLSQDSHSGISLPSIHATARGTTGARKKYITDTKRLWHGVSGKEKSGNGFCTEPVCVAVDKWKELRKCRYLRTCATE